MKKDRRNRRLSTHIDAWITLDGNFAKRTCTILDISDTGARVRFYDVPPQDTLLSLAIAGDVRSARLSRVIWRRGKVAGLQFVATLLAQNRG